MKNPAKKNFKTNFCSSLFKFLMVTNNNPPTRKFPNNRAEPVTEEIGSIDHRELNRAHRQKQTKIRDAGKLNHLILRPWAHKIITLKTLPIITKIVRPFGDINPKIGVSSAITPIRNPRAGDALILLIMSRLPSTY